MLPLFVPSFTKKRRH